MSFQEGNLHTKIEQLEKENKVLRDLILDLGSAMCIGSCYKDACPNFYQSRCMLTKRAKDLNIL